MVDGDEIEFNCKFILLSIICMRVYFLVAVSLGFCYFHTIINARTILIALLVLDVLLILFSIKGRVIIVARHDALNKRVINMILLELLSLFSMKIYLIIA